MTGRVVPKMRRRILTAAVFAVSAVLLVLAGCGAIGGRYVYIEWTASYFEKYYPRWMNDFADLHAEDNVRIRFRAAVSDVTQKVYTMLISHTLSDIIVMGTETQPLLLDNSALEVIPEDFLDTEDFLPITLAVPVYPDGSLAAVPTTIGNRPYMYFNVEHLKEIGTTADDVPETFDEYHEWAGRFLKWELADGTIVKGPLEAEQARTARLLRRPLLLQRGHILSIYPLILTYLDPEPDENGESDHSLDDFFGGPPSDRPFRFDTPEFVEGLREWQKFFISDTGAIADGDTERIQGLTSGRYSSTEAGNWIFGEVFSVNMQVTALPHADDKPLKLPVYLSAYGISRESEHKRLAMEFAKYIAGTERQLDGYYGHGYLPCRFSAYDRIREDDREDGEIRHRFLEPYTDGNEDFICTPRIKRTYHDRMEIYLYVPFSADRRIAAAASTETALEEEAVPAVAGEKVGEEEDRARYLAEKYQGRVATLAADIAAATGQEVGVIVQGTPDEMIPVRSVVTAGPVEVYVKQLPNVVYVPVHKLWGRLQSEVIVRASQFATHPDPSKRMTPEEVAAWAQQEAEDIVAGVK
ncbi:MAG: ABC transporter substrate-binding protein [Planctomycetota bacterium]|jgi:ABC-type glycerol-3-phosphate transport system substrate-binding protein